ncbi:MAG: glutathione S-transferase N-terminal domain-containing protein [SAR324 cluster bacterium]|nr:glutathione S-transferase N-terminal domain-containing protein [SAR324 cluster bacterium]
MQLELYYFDSCPFCQKVTSVIEQLKIQDKIIMKNIHQNQEYAQALVQMNGGRQVPCLVIDGKPMLESADISQFLQSTFAS